MGGRVWAPIRVQPLGKLGMAYGRYEEPLDMGALGRFVYRKVLYERLSGRQALGRGRAAWARAALALA